MVRTAFAGLVSGGWGWTGWIFRLNHRRGRPGPRGPHREELEPEETPFEKVAEPTVVQVIVSIPVGQNGITKAQAGALSERLCADDLPLGVSFLGGYDVSVGDGSCLPAGRYIRFKTWARSKNMSEAAIKVFRRGALDLLRPRRFHGEHHYRSRS